MLICRMAIVSIIIAALRRLFALPRRQHQCPEKVEGCDFDNPCQECRRNMAW